MIKDKIPSTWKKLQYDVGEILMQCGFSVQIEKKIGANRNTIEIDVYAEEIINDRLYTVIFECKYWKRKIPQLFVHALRTVAIDIGVNKAYIISTSGFQSGTISSIQNTNIELLNWHGFQAIFFKSWYINYFSPNLNKIIKTEYDQTAIKFFDNFEIIDRKEFRSLIEQYKCLQEISSHFPSAFLFQLPNYPHSISIDDRLPLNEKLYTKDTEEWEKDCNCLPEKLLKETSHTEFLFLLSDFAKPIYTELDKLDLYMTYD